MSEERTTGMTGRPGFKVMDLISEISAVCAFFQFPMLFLPYGFISIASINVPYTDMGFLTGLLLLLLVAGPVLGLLGIVIIKLLSKTKNGASHSPGRVEMYFLIIMSYCTSIFSFFLYFLNIDGWYSELVPMVVYMIGALCSGVTATIGMKRMLAAMRSTTLGIAMAIFFGATGVASFLLVNFNMANMLAIAGTVCLAVPPVVMLSKDASSYAGKDEVDTVPFAKFENVMNKFCQRSWVTSAALFLLVIGWSNYMAAVNYLKIPEPAFADPTLWYFLGVAGGTILAMVLFTNRSIDGLVYLCLGILGGVLVLSEVFMGFAYSFILMIASGIGTGAAWILLLRVQLMRRAYNKPADTIGGRMTEVYYFGFLAAFLSLFNNISISFMSLGENIPGAITGRMLFQVILIAFAIIGIITVHSTSKYQAELKEGKAKPRATTMTELIMSQNQGKAKKDGDKPSGTPDQSGQPEQI